MTRLRHPVAQSWVSSLVALGAALVVLTVLNPQLVLSATTPAGGDMGAHVLGPAYLRDVLLPQGRVLGWSNAWFAGFPAFYFYFPLPSLFIVFLDLFLPYGVAFKIVAIMGLVALPFAVRFMAASFGFGRWIAAVAAAGAAAFALMESYTIYGGNVASTMAGEFSYSWSFSLGMIYLGLLTRAVRGERRLIPWAVAALAATVLSHVLTTLVLVVASLVVLLRKGAMKTAVTIWGWAFAVTAFWSVPLVMRIGLTSDMSWTPLSRWEEVFPLEIWILLPFALGGMIWSAARHRAAVPLIVATLVPVLYFPLPRLLPELLPSLGEDRWKLWNGRLLPYWYFGVVFFASVAIGALVVWASRRLPDRVSGWWPRWVGVAAAAALGGLLVYRDGPLWAGIAIGVGGAAVAAASLTWLEPVSTRSVLVTVTALVLAVGALAGTNFIYKWSRWNFSGYEAKDAWPEYEGVMATMDGLPPGRVQWEQDSTSDGGLEKYGTPMAPMLFPYWTGWTHPSMEGLYFESSLTTPFHFLNATEMSAKPSSPVPGLEYHRFDFDRGLAHLELYGVRYYVAYSEEAATKADGYAQLTRVTESPPFVIYETAEYDLVEIAAVQPSVYVPVSAPAEDDPTDFDDFALDWYDDPAVLDHPVVAEGPDDWPTASRVSDLVDDPLPGGRVSEVAVADHEVSFTTTAVGVPHIVKISYFPNWTATGAAGPYRATPSLMVVVPTEEHVTLRFENTSAEWVGNGLTLAGIFGFIYLGVSAGTSRLRRRREQAADRPQAA